MFEFNGPFLEKTQLWGEKLAFFFFNSYFTFKTFVRKLLSSLLIPAKFRRKMFWKNRKLTIFLSRNFRRIELCVIHTKQKPVTASRKRNSWVFYWQTRRTISLLATVKVKVASDLEKIVSYLTSLQRSVLKIATINSVSLNSHLCKMNRILSPLGTLFVDSLCCFSVLFFAFR